MQFRCWKPISSAPKSECILGRANNLEALCIWEGDRWEVIMTHADDDLHISESWQPTEWMLLSEIPE